MNKKLKITIGVIILAVLLGVGVFYAVTEINDYGVKSVRIKEADNGEYNIVFKQSAVEKYSVRCLEADEPVYIKGETAVERDSTMGKNIIEVTFHDMSFSEKFRKNYTENYELKAVPESLKSKIKIRIASVPDDSNFYLYISSDEPIFAENQKGMEVGGFADDIVIPLAIN